MYIHNYSHFFAKMQIWNDFAAAGGTRPYETTPCNCLCHSEHKRRNLYFFKEKEYICENRVFITMKKIIRNILRGCSLTAALFVFEACYGTPPHPGAEAELGNAQDSELAEGAETVGETDGAVAINPE